MAQQVLFPKVKEVFSHNANWTYVLKGEPGCVFAIKNLGAASLTFTIHDMTITVPAGDSFEDWFEDFTEVTVLSAVLYEGIVKGW